MEFSAIPPLPRAHQDEWCWQQRFLTCYTLHTVVEQRKPMDWTLRCSIAEAKAILALYLGNKALVTLQYAVRPQSILNTEMVICQLTPRQMAHIPLHLDPPEGLWDRFEKFWLWRPILRYRLQLETAVEETVYEIFHLSGWRSLPDKKPSREKLQSLGVLHLHFFELANGGSYLRVFVGWNEACTPESQKQLRGLLDGYLIRLYLLCGQPVQPKGVRQERPRNRESSHEMPLVREIAAEVKPAITNQQPDPIAGTTTSALGLSRQSDTLNGAVAPVVPQTTGENQSQSHDTLYAEERRWSGGARPRFYKNTLLKICRLAAHRQAAIAQGKPVPDITPLINQYGLSPNTISKAGRLTAAWQDPAFAWNVIALLREHSGHTPDEITDFLNHLRTNLNREEWALVTGAT